MTHEPSRSLWTAALAGLMGITACGDDPKVEPDPTPDASSPDAATPDAPAPDAPGPTSKIISETPGEHTFAELTAMCDARGGYTEIYAACSGSNSCAGFSYGDWGAGAVLIEHTCAAVSGCNGMGCVVLPADGGKTPQDILAAELPDTEGVAQRSCNYCHATWNEDGTFDATHFKVKVPPGSTRTLANWRDKPAAAQARVIAFGAHGQYDNGVQFGHMAGYRTMYSRAEIERVVDYIRTTATISVEEIKTQDAVLPRLGGKRFAIKRAGAPDRR